MGIISESGHPLVVVVVVVNVGFSKSMNITSFVSGRNQNIELVENPVVNALSHGILPGHPYIYCGLQLVRTCLPLMA